MQKSPPLSPTQSQRQRLDQPRVSHIPQPPMAAGDTSSVWDWGDLLDFTVDDDLAISWASADPPNPPESHHLPPPDDPPENPNPSAAPAARIRKRDPRLACSNFLAGHVPCACPEVDEKMMELEEEEAGHGKKRVRTVRAPPGTARCQVPTCGADIKELKGYHRRHRVCLACANATTVVLGGETKRYCQQCGKFHVLSDFDEGKRSCRRKLERHNNRRRRKPSDSKAGKESQREVQTEGGNHDGEAGEDSLQLSSQINEKEDLVESEGGGISTLFSMPNSQNVGSDGVASALTSGDTQMDGGKHDSNHSLSPPQCDNKSVYSSMCPTGRISFKLYDWNPAEFPRRLRHQIFQWLASMPVELEGYIRPGCIILTVFIAMPKFMWMKLLDDPASYLHNFVIVPGRMLSGRGNMLVYLNDMIFRVVKDGTSVIKAKVEVRAPRLHYIHPTCFEAGKPMEFFVCGSNLLQPKLRFLVSFSGKYLADNYDLESSHTQIEGDSTAANIDHQLYKIHVPHTEATSFGPAFIEVENESGLSNFLPVLIGNKEICAEMESIQKRLEESLFVRGSSDVSSSGSLLTSCEASSLRHRAFSEVILDIAWLLRKPSSENVQQIMTSSQAQRFNNLLNLLIFFKSTTILEKVLENLNTLMDNVEINNPDSGSIDADMRLLQKYMDCARDILSQKLQSSGVSVVEPGSLVQKQDLISQSLSRFQSKQHFLIHTQDTEIIVDGKMDAMLGSTSNERSETLPLLNKKAATKANLIKQANCGISSGELLSSRSRRTFLGFRSTLYVISATAMCLGICAVVFHPHKVGELAVTIRRCLFDKI
ncbi:putative transcription factor SBP family [Rosa chinensis]|uniref:Putative transcription factor SBP family n=1 Tax=Rosa chinensis TaxID=74649 RepID=A0A2P6QXU8_ROSCH|nr:squamosa promoter-binding-like protein 7 [Rosa chinensis]PRQ39023.1 putative transcription factor SBP family [Rosa chinensis]